MIRKARTNSELIVAVLACMTLEAGSAEATLGSPAASPARVAAVGATNPGPPWG